MRISTRKNRFLEELEGRLLMASDFTVVALSDTQYTVESWPATFQAQTQWAADHASDPAYNIAFLAHQGDMLRRGYSNTQAASAASALNVLNGVVPYTVDIGNHDFDNQFDDLDHHISSANFTSWFGDARYASLYASGDYGSSPDQRNRFTIFNGGGQRYMVLSVEWEAEDSAIAWAQGVINAHRELPVILTTHEYLNGSGRTTSPLDPAANSGEAIYQKLVKPNPQIFLVLSGHTGAVMHRTVTNGSTNPALQTVFETVSDFEGRSSGNSGYLQLFHFYPDQNTITVSSYSPTLNQFDTSSSTYSFSLPINFATRFAFATATPIANDDAFATAPGQEVDGTVLANDVANGGTLAVSLVSGPSNGALSFNPDGTFAYVPNAGYHGTDTFKYAVAGGNVAMVTLRNNSAPGAADDAVATPESRAVTLNAVANDSDPDGDGLRPMLTSLPAHGAVFANADGTFTYTPDPKYVGADSFTYVAGDGVDLSAPVTVNVSVTAAPPVYSYPIAETTTYGTRSGSYTNLAASDGVEEKITEVSRLGSAVLDQRWQFNVTAGSDIDFVIRARRSLGTDEYHFRYSTDGSNWSDLTQFVPASSKDVTRVQYDVDEPYQMWHLPNTISGNLWIRATDTKSNTDLCSLSVDEMFVRTVGAMPVVPPAAPTGLSGSYARSSRKATLRWTDKSTNETGFRVWYSTNNGQSWQVYTTLGVNTTSFTTSALTRGLTYLFKVSAYNTAGDSLFSNTVSVLAS